MFYIHYRLILKTHNECIDLLVGRTTTEKNWHKNTVEITFFPSNCL